MKVVVDEVVARRLIGYRVDVVQAGRVVKLIIPFARSVDALRCVQYVLWGSYDDTTVAHV